MQIAGFQKLTLIDYPDHVAALIFTPGCNLRCQFCYNAEMVLPEKLRHYKNFIKEKDVLETLKQRKNFLEGVVISGGEPTLQPDLKNFMKKLKKLEYKVKLDTNGTNPEVLKDLLQEHLLDFIAMDIKSSLKNYPKTAGVKIEEPLKNVVSSRNCSSKHVFQRFLDTKKITQSIQSIMESGIDYEFRSTIMPKFHNTKEIRRMAQLIKGAKHYALQTFMPRHTLDPKMLKEKPYTDGEMKKLAEIAKRYVKNVEVRS